ncbi:hypothetical protein BJ973_000576 [Actinoplanes tereljensis]|uniref:Uncharacterized protein n=1 Tax=Paractinoplanes tereljensis TaxID=571912 RepID=A0A919NS75_9ACTN|nr:hypothetical protein [Actinoplanes tereljensis]GIF23066.1 hypothetical protein Ate02nite_57960 [Actinoplanes tereljensis]
MFRKSTVISACGIVTGLLSGALLYPAAASAAVIVSLTGQRSTGYYEAGSHRVRTYAGTYIGEFTPEDCADAGSQIRKQFQDKNLKVDREVGASVPLEYSRRMLVLGVWDETDDKYFSACVNISPNGLGIYRYENGNGPFLSGEWVVNDPSFNGQRFYMQYSDNDGGAANIGFRINRPVVDTLV